MSHLLQQSMWLKRLEMQRALVVMLKECPVYSLPVQEGWRKVVRKL